MLRLAARIFFGQAKQLDAVIGGIDAGDRILPALGHPRRAVGANRDAVGRGALAEIDQPGRAVARIEPPQRPVALAGEPDRAVGRGRHVMRAHARVKPEVFYPERTFLRATLLQQRGRSQDSGGGRSEKLAAIYGVTPASCSNGLGR